MTEAQQPDALKKLVIFIIALAILGTFVSSPPRFHRGYSGTEGPAGAEQRRRPILPSRHS